MSDVLKLVNYTGRPVVVFGDPSLQDGSKVIIPTTPYLAYNIVLPKYDFELCTDYGTLYVQMPERYGLRLRRTDSVEEPMDTPMPQALMGVGYIIPPDVARCVQSSPGYPLSNLFTPIEVDSFVYVGLRRLYPL